MPRPSDELTHEEYEEAFEAYRVWINDLFLALGFQLLSQPGRSVTVPSEPGALEGQTVETTWNDDGSVTYRLVPVDEVDPEAELAAIEEVLEVLPPANDA